MDGHMKYTSPSEFTLMNHRVLVYNNYHSYVVCSKGGPNTIRVVKLPSPRDAFIVYGDYGNVFAEAIGGVFFIYSKYYGTPIHILADGHGSFQSEPVALRE